MAALTGRDLGLSYPDRCAALTAAGIALWDVLAAATRPGSLDAAIRDATTNPLSAFITAHPSLRAVAFNGATAARLGRPPLAATNLALVALPSTSPAHTMPLETKRAAWATLTQYLEPAG